MRIHSNLATASELKGMGATRGQIQLAKSGWRSVELDPDSSKHQIKKARIEQGRIAHLYWNTGEPIVSRTMACLQTIFQSCSGDSIKRCLNKALKHRPSSVEITPFVAKRLLKKKFYRQLCS